MNRWQKVILAGAVLLILATSLFPPMSWIEVFPLLYPYYWQDSKGIYHDMPSIEFRRGLRFIGYVSDGRILWPDLAAECTLVITVAAGALYARRSRGRMPAKPE